MRRSVLKSWILLLYLDCVMHLRTFKALHDTVRRQAVSAPTGVEPNFQHLCRATDLACALYFKRVLCLQRSAATAIAIRRSGSPADLVIGAQLLPFRSHAWVEVEGHVVNDKPYLPQIFQALDRL